MYVVCNVNLSRPLYIKRAICVGGSSDLHLCCALHNRRCFQGRQRVGWSQRMDGDEEERVWGYVQVFKWFTKRSSSPPSPAVARIIFSAASRNCKCIFWQCTFLICIFQRRVCQSEMNTAGVTHLLKARAKRMPGTVGPLDRDQSGSKLQGWQRGSQYHGCLWLLRFCIIKHEHQMMRGSYCISKNYQDLGKKAGAKALWGGKE